MSDIEKARIEQLELAPMDDESPITTMDVEELEKFALYADGLSAILGQDAFKAFKPEAFAELITLLPDEAFKPSAFVGLPGGMPQDVERLPILDNLEEEGSISQNKLDALRDQVRQAKTPDENPLSNFVNPLFEETGSGEGGIFGSGDPGDDGDGERTPERNPDGTLDGSS